MKISVKSFLSMRQVMDGRAVVGLEVEDMTLLEFLYELTVIYGKPFSDTIFDENKKYLNQHIRVLVNGRHYSHLPRKLDTRLNEGDEVCLFPPVAGG